MPKSTKDLLEDVIHEYLETNGIDCPDVSGDGSLCYGLAYTLIEKGYVVPDENNTSYKSIPMKGKY